MTRRDKIGIAFTALVVLLTYAVMWKIGYMYGFEAFREECLGHMQEMVDVFD